jgi:steroid 5-alpha reductase family enzyme
VSATGRWLDPAFLGAVILTGLFHGSTNFTEEITRSKYPSYAEYQKRTSRLLPLPPKG